MMHDHHAHHTGHDHHAHAGRQSGAVLRLALTLTLSFAVVEALAGWWSGSLALLGDAGHMVSDSVALGLAALAAWVGQRPPSARHSYGLMRAEVLAALLNGLIMLALVVVIVVEAIRRFQNPQPVAGPAVMVVAFVGLIVNLVVAYILGRGERSLNVRGALLHVMGDLLASIAALLAGAVITFTGWTPIDPILSLVICALILFSTLRLLRETLHVLMEGVPRDIDLERVGLRMAQAAGVVSVHDLHIWTVASGMPALSAHVVLRDIKEWNAVLARLRELLARDYGIDHVTLQPEVPEAQTLRRMRRPR